MFHRKPKKHHLSDDPRSVKKRAPMEFNYSEEQLALQDTLQRFISRDYDFDKRRAFSASPSGLSAEAWSQYAELGLLALPFPEELGGLVGNAFDTRTVIARV